MIYKYNDIRTIHLEITDKCNAACPQCPRSDRGGPINPLLPLTELTVVNIKKIFPDDFIRQLELMYACGNYGDPAYAKETLEIYQHFRNLNKGMALSMMTNGGIRPATWWSNLAEVIGKQGHVTFSIDGLEDTNHIYRRNVKWANIMRNAQAFIEAGGSARWDFIVFKHNEHQIDEAEQLAKDMGFTRFEIKKTGRFFYAGKILDSTPIKNKSGEIVGNLEKPSEKWRNQALEEVDNLIDRYGSMENYYNNTNITCKAETKNSLYVTADGMVFPCCWVGGMATYNHTSPQKQQLLDLMAYTGSINKLNALETDLKGIIEGDFFKEVKKSWFKESIKAGKLLTCSRICGDSFNQYDKQKDN